MSSKWTSIVQNINPRIAFTLVICFMILWVLSRPLKWVGENIYLICGSSLNSSCQTVINTKSSLTELINARNKSKEQERTITFLKQKIYTLENQNDKYKALSSVLNLKKNLSNKTFVANVIGRSPDNWHKQLIIDKGSADGIKTGDSVLSSKGIVGQIVDVNKNSSFVQLISDSGFRIGCKLKRTKLLGILTGKSSKLGTIQFIPIGNNVRVGDYVVTSGISCRGLSQTYPPNHPIGRVSKISKKKIKNADLYIEVKLNENLTMTNEVIVFSSF